MPAALTVVATASQSASADGSTTESMMSLIVDVGRRGESDAGSCDVPLHAAATSRHTSDAENQANAFKGHLFRKDAGTS
jgi:hypothetical protein